jgi:hypothetical protein
VLLTVEQSSHQPVFPWFWPPQLDISVRNTGDTTEKVTVIVEEYALSSGGEDFDCTHGSPLKDGALSCDSEQPLQPESQIGFQAQRNHWAGRRTVTVTARLGSAEDTERVIVEAFCPSPLCHWPGGIHDKDTDKPGKPDKDKPEPADIPATTPESTSTAAEPEASTGDGEPTTTTTPPPGTSSSPTPSTPSTPSTPDSPSGKQPAPSETPEPSASRSPANPPEPPPTRKPWLPWTWWLTFD